LLLSWPTSHTSNTIDKLNKSKLSWTFKHFHVGAAVGMLVVVLMLYFSSAMDGGEAVDNAGGSSGGDGSSCDGG
jgi:hypothetical protein